MPIYAHYGVAHAWLVDPLRKTLEAYVLDNRDRRLLAEASGDDTITAAAYEALELDLSGR